MMDRHLEDDTVKKHREKNRVEVDSRGNREVIIAKKSEFRQLGGSQQVKNEIRRVIDGSYTGVKRNKDKSDHSVVEKVIDRKTESLFKKWEKNGIIKTVNGCISTGKEANVYHAETPEGKELAIKIYKVETMVFREREDYIEGEFRFRRGRIVSLKAMLAAAP